VVAQSTGVVVRWATTTMGAEQKPLRVGQAGFYCCGAVLGRVRATLAGQSSRRAKAYTLRAVAFSRNRAVDASDAGIKRPALPKPCGGMLP